MYCANCGREIDTEFCPACGAKNQMMAEQQPPVQQYQQPVLQPGRPPAPQHAGGAVGGRQRANLNLPVICMLLGAAMVLFGLLRFIDAQQTIAGLEDGRLGYSSTYNEYAEGWNSNWTAAANTRARTASVFVGLGVVLILAEAVFARKGPKEIEFSAAPEGIQRSAGLWGLAAAGIVVSMLGVLVRIPYNLYGEYRFWLTLLLPLSIVFSAASGPAQGAAIGGCTSLLNAVLMLVLEGEYATVDWMGMLMRIVLCTLAGLAFQKTEFARGECGWREINLFFLLCTGLHLLYGVWNCLMGAFAYYAGGYDFGLGVSLQYYIANPIISWLATLCVGAALLPLLARFRRSAQKSRTEL